MLSPLKLNHNFGNDLTGAKIQIFAFFCLKSKFSTILPNKMKSKHYCFLKIVTASTFIYSLTVFPCNAQITPDIALPKNSTTRLETDTTVIEGGTQAGNNLFHSFQSFSVMKGSTAFFNNTADIQNIISRVTGKSASNIDGLIRANGVANLFLINPNGIIFGPNARLDIGGSFLGSTANSINFADGFQFRATNPQAKPLLSISVPTSLQFRGNSESIRVLGTGLIIPASDFRLPLDASKFTNDGLQVNAKKTLALIGGDVLLNGGIISTKNGRIELGSVDKGEVSIRQVNNGWLFNYEKVPSFRDINLSQNSLVYVNSLEGTGNTINIQGRETRILDGSLVFSQNQGYKQNAKITINASNLLEIKDSTQLSLSAIFTSNFGKTPGEDIEIHAKNLAIEGGQIATTTFTDAPGGKVAVNADDSLKIIGSPPSPVNPFGYGAINTFTYINYGDGGDIVGRIGNLILENNGVMTTASSSHGKAGDVNLLAENITIKNGSSLGSTTFNLGSGGDVFVNAKTLIEITGGSGSVGASSINAATFGSGNAGKLEIYTPQMVIRDGATVSTSTVSSGNAGNITINSFNSIEVSGKDSNSMNSSSIDSSANILPESLRTRFSRVPATPTGDAGSISLYTGRLNVINGAEVSVRNDGSGNAGKLQIKSNTIDIINNGSIAATTAIGQGGDIGINSNYLQLQDGIISATAGTQGTNGDGGNIIVNTDILAALGNSRITANAYKGRGGNV
ncbi:MAG: filamentous hemagglutinin N-terminal domain-containing protein, partial [Nostoc sp.]|uniref:two-partner secretion domain-containing protein n=1 Tax=Nostoc sp. TaxID=1180 RepID=UPI002FF898A0